MTLTGHISLGEALVSSVKTEGCRGLCKVVCGPNWGFRVECGTVLAPGRQNALATADDSTQDSVGLTGSPGHKVVSAPH